MAEVYEGEDVLLGRKVAVKLLREQFASDAAFLERFQREAKAAAGLTHPNVVTVYDVGSEEGTQYIVMELVDGRTLKEVVRQEGPLSAARIIDLGRQICEGLEFAHQHRIVHRDVKAQNILVTRDGRAKIADFGIAVALGASSLTQSGYVVGTVQYMSPEQAQGESTSALSDLYSTAVILYELATGGLPFQGEAPVAVALKHVQEDPIAPREINPRIPESLQAVILRGLAKDPGQRFASAAEMAEALMACARAGFEATVATPIPEVLTPVNVPKGTSTLSHRERKEDLTPVNVPKGTSTLSHREREKKGDLSQRDRETGAPARSPLPRRHGKESRSGGWIVMAVVFAAFLLVIGSIPVGILAYSNGSLNRFLAGSPPPTPTPRPTPQPTETPPTPVPAPERLRVPRLVGMPFADARQLAQASGLDVTIAGEAYDPTIPVAAVVSQKPAAGGQAEKGARIEVVVSLGKEVLTLPKVVGDTVSAVQARLQAAGFQVKVTEEWNDRVPAGVVTAQDPPADTKLDRGSEVALTVSKGKEKVAVPSLVGLPEVDAQDAIVKAGLTKTWVNYQDFTFVPPGNVLSQEPKAGTLVDKGSVVYIAVRRGGPPTPTTPPTPAPRSTPPVPSPAPTR